MSAVATAVIGGAVIGGGLSSIGQQQAGDAASQAANAQMAQASRNQSQALGYLNGSTGMSQATNLAQATPQELNVLSQSYQAASQNVGQQQQLMASIDPALMQASQQALSIMQGGTAALNSPMMAQRNQQRAQLQNSLNAQYGPGSQIAQQQLNNFDTQTDSMFQQNQLGALSTYGNYQNQGMQASQGAMGSALGGLMGVGQGYSAIQNRMLNTQMQNQGMYTNSVLGTGNNLVANAGGNSLASGIMGQGMASMGQGLMGSSMNMGMMGLMGGSSGSTYNFNSPAGTPTDSSGFPQLTMPTLGS